MTTAKTIAERLKPRVPHNKWTDQDIEKLVSWYEKGYAIKDIAKALGRTTRAIYLEITKLRQAGQESEPSGTTPANLTNNVKPEIPKQFVDWANSIGAKINVTFE